MLTVAQAVVLGALHRRESRGCHSRMDFPKAESEFARHSLVKKQNGAWSVEYRPINQHL